MSEKKLICGRPKWIIDTDISLSSCPGCGHPIATRAILETIDELTKDKESRYVEVG